MRAIEIGCLLLLAGAGATEAKPRIAVVIDDFGLTYPTNVPDERWMKLPWPYTAAVMPESPRTKKAAEAAKKAGKEVIVHFPFDPFLRLELPAGGKASPKDVELVRELLEKALKAIPQAVGLNNHRSLKATQNAALMGAFMPELKKRGLYFLDSRVSPKSVAYQEAKAAGLRAAKNDIFLEEGKKRSKEFCQSMLRRAAGWARKRGQAVAIGHHYFSGTYDCLAEAVPQLQEEGFEFVFASELAN